MSGRFSMKRRFLNMSPSDFVFAVTNTARLMEAVFGVPMKYEIRCYGGVITTTSFDNPEHQAYLNTENKKILLGTYDNVDAIAWENVCYMNCTISPVDEDKFSYCYCHISCGGLTPKVIPFLMACSCDNAEEKIAKIRYLLTYCSGYLVGDGFEENTNRNGAICINLRNPGVFGKTNEGFTKIV